MRPLSGLGGGFRRLWWAVLAAGSGDGIRIGVLPLLAAALTRDPGWVAAISFAGSLPWLLVGPFTGVVTDRGNRYRILIRMDVLRGTVLAVFALIMALGQLSLAVLMAANFLLGSAKTLRDNAAFAVVPHLVPVRLLETAGGRIQATVLVTEELLGPPLGVLLFSLFEAVPLAMAAVFFGMAAWLLLGVEAAAMTTGAAGGHHLRAAPGWRGVMTDIFVGMRWLAAHRLLRALCVLNALSNIGVISVVTIAVLYAFEILRVGQVVYAALLVVVAIGGVVGAVLASAVATRLGKGLVLQLAFVLAPLAFVVTGSTSSPYLAAGAFAVVGMSVSVCNVISVALRQTLVPDALLGRVNAAFRMVAFGLAPFGAVAAGLVAGQLGLRAPFFFGAGLLTLGLVLALFTVSNRVVQFHLEREAST